MDKLIAAWQATSNLELVSVVFGLAYVVLAARGSRWCWPCAFVGTATAVVLFWDGLLPMEAALNVYYLAMAVYGWWQWRGGGNNSQSTQVLKITSWDVKQHVIWVLAVLLLTMASGFLLDRHTQAALPYLDSFTTWSAVITTWMVTRKILENWLYWLLINSASIYLYLEREFYLYAALFVIYLVIALYGYAQWRTEWRNQNAHA